MGDVNALQMELANVEMGALRDALRALQSTKFAHDVATEMFPEEQKPGEWSVEPRKRETQRR